MVDDLAKDGAIAAILLNLEGKTRAGEREKHVTTPREPGFRVQS